MNSPKDLKKLTISQMETLAEEIREFLIDSVSETGGHLSSNLGVVELTIALHYSLNTPKDKIVWDVGHQSYVHKILTGRMKQFNSIRQKNGISGFPKIDESIYDSFGTGHSSTSISASFAIATARDLLNEKHKVVSVIGDGSMTGGLAYEALNNAGRSETDLLVILNDNEMSISKNVGALSKHLNDLRSAPSYIGAKADVSKILKKVPVVGNDIVKAIEITKEKIKYMLVQGILFEEMGFRYFGPVDGHDIKELISNINKVKKIKGPVLLHVYTKKGKGYNLAESDPKKYHGISAFNVLTGNSKNTDTTATYSDVFGSAILNLAEENNKIVAITAAMVDGTGLTRFSKRFPERFFDVGIAESHAVVFAAGLASKGLIPVVAIYSTFLQRAYDQVVHDVCVQNLHVVFAIDRAGVVPGDGPTHQGVYDLSFLSHIPNLVIMAPKNGQELTMMLKFAISHKAPIAIRYPKDSAKNVFSSFSNISIKKSSDIRLGKSEVLIKGKEIAIIALGSMVETAYDAAKLLNERNIYPYVINARFAKPLDYQMIDYMAYKTSYIFTIEDNALLGGFGSQVLEYCSNTKNINIRIHNFAIPDMILPQGSRKEILSSVDLDAHSISLEIERIYMETEHESAGKTKKTTTGRITGN